MAAITKQSPHAYQCLASGVQLISPVPRTEGTSTWVWSSLLHYFALLDSGRTLTASVQNLHHKEGRWGRTSYFTL